MPILNDPLAIARQAAADVYDEGGAHLTAAHYRDGLRDAHLSVAIRAAEAMREACASIADGRAPTTAAVIRGGS